MGLAIRVRFLESWDRSRMNDFGRERLVGNSARGGCETIRSHGTKIRGFSWQVALRQACGANTVPLSQMDRGGIKVETHNTKKMSNEKKSESSS
jgi:hypothetical protein